MCSETSDLAPVPQDLSDTHLPDPDDLNTHRSGPSGLTGASVSVAVMHPDPHVGTARVRGLAATRHLMSAQRG